MQNRLGANLTEFMRHFLGSEGEEVRKSDVYTAIKKLVTDSDAASVRVLMTRMERLSTLYSRLSAFAPEPHPDLERYFDHFKRLDFGSVYPLLLSLYDDYDEGQFSIDEFASTLRILHSFILRRLACSRSEKGQAANSPSSRPDGRARPHKIQHRKDCTIGYRQLIQRAGIRQKAKRRSKKRGLPLRSQPVPEGWPTADTGA